MGWIMLKGIKKELLENKLQISIFLWLIIVQEKRNTLEIFPKN